ncbi:MAG: hypothetical protein JRH20_16330, partial [Deltaproteobacteria bacterium]|nr:hypothetical protein [Deltaproteobacteria bacterium]
FVTPGAPAVDGFGFPEFASAITSGVRKGADAIKEGYQALEHQLDIHVADGLANWIEVKTDSGFVILRQHLPQGGKVEFILNVVQAALRQRLKTLAEEGLIYGVKKLAVLVGKNAVRGMTIAGWVAIAIKVAAILINLYWRVDIGAEFMAFLETNAPILVPVAEAVEWLLF